MDNRYKRLGINTLWVFLGRSGNFIMAFIMLPLYTHWLSPGEYGEGDLIQTYSTIFMCFTTCCIAQSIFIFPKNCTELEKKKYYSSGWAYIFVAICLAAIIFFIIEVITRKIGYKGTLTEHLWLIYGLMFANFIQEYTQQFTRSIDKMSIYSTTGIIQSVLVAITSVIFIPLYGFIGYILSLIFSPILAAFYSFVASRSYSYLSLSSFDRDYLKKLLVYGIPLIPNTIMWWIVNGFNRPIIEETLGLFAVGLFAIANKFPGIVTNVSTIFTNAWGISMLEEFGKPGFSVFFNKNVKFIFTILVLLCAIVSIFSKQILLLFADESYIEAWKILPILVIGALFSSMSSLVGGIFMALKNSKFFFLSSVAGGFSSVILTFILIKAMGLQGAAWATALSFFIILVFRVKFAWKYLSDLNILYYLKMLLILTILTVLVIMEFPIYIKAFFILCFFIFFFIFNRSEIYLAFNFFISLFNKRQ